MMHKLISFIIVCNFTVESLIYWRDPKKSGIVFGAGIAILLAISFFSVISVFAYMSLLGLVGTMVFRIYKNILQAVQKTSEGHPFKYVYILISFYFAVYKLNFFHKKNWQINSFFFFFFDYN